MTEIIAIISMAIKLAILIFEKTKTSEAEVRREALSKLDQAIEKAKVDKDMRDLSKWIGERL